MEVSSSIFVNLRQSSSSSSSRYNEEWIFLCTWLADAQEKYQLMVQNQDFFSSRGMGIPGLLGWFRTSKMFSCAAEQGFVFSGRLRWPSACKARFRSWQCFIFLFFTRMISTLAGTPVYLYHHNVLYVKHHK